MGITKTEGFRAKITDTARVFKALGHPARFAIIEFLVQNPSCIYNEIVDQIPLAQPTVSRHIAELKNAGLIKGTIEGKNICYCINEKRWAALKNVMDQLKIPKTNKTQSCLKQ